MYVLHLPWCSVPIFRVEGWKERWGLDVMWYDFTCDMQYDFRLRSWNTWYRLIYRGTGIETKHILGVGDRGWGLTMGKRDKNRNEWIARVARVLASYDWGTYSSWGSGHNNTIKSLCIFWSPIIYSMLIHLSASHKILQPFILCDYLQLCLTYAYIP